jgi:hypothetical protein
MEIVDFLLLVLNIISGVYDINSYIKSRANRKERKQAKEVGQRPPKRNRWTVAFYILTPVIIILTTYLIWKKL